MVTAPVLLVDCNLAKERTFDMRQEAMSVTYDPAGSDTVTVGRVSADTWEFGGVAQPAGSVP